jgi:hypothetical protein
MSIRTSMLIEQIVHVLSARRRTELVTIGLANGVIGS